MGGVKKGLIHMPKPTIGRIVHFVMPHATDLDPTKGHKVHPHRPAIITRVWERDDGEMPLVQLQVFTDGSNDEAQNVEWQTSVHYSEAHEPRSWHWPEREE